ncbi:MAG TPA: ATP-grasp domain-containing protein [Pirellulales bacterium]|jgi:predicted ATP-grasp superfamily ATP-dependent carboligase
MTFRNATSGSLLILGASTRAAAFSALAAGLRPSCADQFADADLASHSPVVAVEGYPQGLDAAARNAPDGPWMYTGALENHPTLIDRIAAQRPLLGMGGAVLSRIRDPWTVSRVLRAAHLAVPEIRRTPQDLGHAERWLRKSRSLSAGAGIGHWQLQPAGTQRPTSDRRQRTHYFQRYVEGRACAAIYLAAAGQARLLGATEQLLVSGTAQGGHFRYAGSLGPLPADARRDSRLQRLGNVLAEFFHLRGLFGVDFIDDGREIWPVEINPRYTASIEILERAASFSAVGAHVAACRDEQIPEIPPPAGDSWHGKRILYANHDIQIDDALTAKALAARDSDAKPLVADIPHAGTAIKRGQPVMTVFAAAATHDEMVSALASTTHSWNDALMGCRTKPFA